MKKWALIILCLLLPLQLAAQQSGTRTLNRDNMETMLRDAVMQQSPWKNSAGITLENIKAPDTITIPEAYRRTATVKFAPQEDFLGFTTATLVFGKQAMIRVPVNATIRVKTEVPVAKMNIRRGAIVSADDIEMRATEITRFPGVATKIKDCVGMRVKTFVRKDTPIVLANIDAPPLVFRGKPVLIEASGEDLIITDKGIAMMDGQMDQRISVRNTRSGKQIMATVVAPSRVRVEF